MSRDYRALVELARRAAHEAGAIILDIYGSDFAVERKSDRSPVTLADRQAEASIIAALSAATPDIPVIAEEQAATHGAAAPTACFWLVDPLDGTREFVKRNGEFTVNIALVEGGRTVLGVVYIPVTDLTYTGHGPGTATRQRGREQPLPIAARRTPASGAVVVHSRSHTSEARIAAYLAALPGATPRIMGSSAKFCLLAEGEADFYPRFGRTMEWDTGAGQAVLEAAAGHVTTLAGMPLAYAKPGYENPDFIASGAKS
jgi:3'(2'), 5'-bisphosphate nucleotidase